MRRVIGFSYVLRDSAGTLIDQSGDDPLYFLEGNNQIIPGLERVVIGMDVGEKRRVIVPAADAYGEHNPAYVVEVRRSQFPPDAELTVGEQFAVAGDAPGPLFTIVAIGNETVTVDGNHPMAGKELHFDIEIVGIRAATEQETAQGYATPPDG